MDEKQEDELRKKFGFDDEEIELLKKLRKKKQEKYAEENIDGELSD